MYSPRIMVKKNEVAGKNQKITGIFGVLTVGRTHLRLRKMYESEIE